MTRTVPPPPPPPSVNGRRWPAIAVAASVTLAAVIVLAVLPLASTGATVATSFSFEMGLPTGDIKLVPASTYCDPSNPQDNATISLLWNTSDGQVLQRFGLFLALGVNEFAALYYVTNATSGGFAFLSHGVCGDPMEYEASASTPTTVEVSGLMVYSGTRPAPIL
ncbi:MAG TPA: hypothetical protein VEL82_04735 [Thermoplasmata archaeon]|nr:hypothetical protein [Thermoplasmata archaeon]